MWAVAGSSGFHYLATTAKEHRIFRDLFNLSTFLIPRGQLAPILPDIKRHLAFFSEASRPTHPPPGAAPPSRAALPATLRRFCASRHHDLPTPPTPLPNPPNRAPPRHRHQNPQVTPRNSVSDAPPFALPAPPAQKPSPQERSPLGT